MTNPTVKQEPATISIDALNGTMAELQNQRNEALNKVASIAGELAVYKARVAELEEAVAALEEDE
tara:strand:- start:1025 stop:1219 length:195 start_codon:yes stop_codon:yes gene_type:complete